MVVLGSRLVTMTHCLFKEARKNFATLLTLLCIIAAFCLSPNVRAAEVNNAKRTVLIMGDSLAAAYGIRKQQGWGYLLEEKLANEYPDTDWQVINASVSGETTAGGLRRITPLLETNHVDVCVLALGANDGLNGLPLERMRLNLSSMIEQCQAEPAKVVLLGIKLPPNYGSVYTDQFESIYTQLVAKYQVPLEPFFLRDVIFRDGYMQKDKLHPSALAQPAILETVWTILKPVLDEVVEPPAIAGT